jgi:hypothetical protein
MRMMLKVTVPTEAGNRGVKDGTLPDVIRKTLEAISAEAAYFTTMDGRRTMIAVFDMKSPSDMPPTAPSRSGEPRHGSTAPRSQRRPQRGRPETP